MRRQKPLYGKTPTPQSQPLRCKKSVCRDASMRSKESLLYQKPMRSKKPLSKKSASHSTSHAMGLVVSPDLSSLPLAQLQAMQQAGLKILACYRVLQKAEMNVVGEVLRDTLNKGETFYEYNHYPDDDVYDRESHAQYYYHAHRGEVGEHGHFHCFLRPKGMPAGVMPIEHPATDPWPKGDEALSHLLAIAMDGYGYPTGLFTTNRWVTAEAWYPAEQVIQMLDHFVIDHAFPSWPVNRWISAMLILYRPHIEALLKRRDETVWAWAESYPGEDVFEDRMLDITSQIPISVEDTLREIKLMITSSQQQT